MVGGLQQRRNAADPLAEGKSKSSEWEEKMGEKLGMTRLKCYFVTVYNYSQIYALIS